MSTKPNSSDITISMRPGGYAVVTLAKEPVNSMSLDFWESIAKVVRDLENDPQCKAVIFTSGLQKNVFTAGNDINELYAPHTSLERYRKFWISSNQFLASLYNSPLLTICAVKGACPAGGCVLAMVCDYRVVTEDATMGLNEVALGITVPLMWYRCMAALIGQGKAEKLTIFAKIVGAKEALSLGLVDEIASGVSELLPRAEKVATELSRLPAGSRAITKDHSRGPLSREWGNAERLEDEVKGAFASLESPEVTAMLKGVLARLSKGSAKAKL